MLWKDGGRSSNLEDKRGGGGGKMGMGLGGSAVLLVLSLLFGRNLFEETGTTPSLGTQAGGGALTAADSAREEPAVRFVSFVLDDAQTTWKRVLPEYRDAKLVVFRGATQTACGTGQSAMGPFYCPADEKVYIDLGFYDELRTKFGADGDFAQAYVLAHEIGHHVQHLTGTSAQVQRVQRQGGPQANQASVALELQADCYAGVWGRSTENRKILEAGDVDEAIRAAASVGDDAIQSRTTGQVRPESFTHGTAAQRAQWFKRGFESGDPKACDTFSG